MRQHWSRYAPILLVCDGVFLIATTFRIGAYLWQILNIPKLLWKNANI